MKKRSLLLSGFLLFLSAVLLPYVPIRSPRNSLGESQPERPKFCALQIVSEKSVLNAKDSLGVPDGRYAEILPAEQLIILMEEKLYPFPIFVPQEGGSGLADSGSVVGQGETDLSLEGWFPVQDEQGRQDYVWKPLGISLTGFCIWLEGSAGVDMIRITNLGHKSLLVDAVIGYGREAEGK